MKMTFYLVAMSSYDLKLYSFILVYFSLVWIFLVGV